MGEGSKDDTFRQNTLVTLEMEQKSHSQLIHKNIEKYTLLMHVKEL